MLIISKPSGEQVSRFTDHVFGAHSWYKHLPLTPPGRSFHFFLTNFAGYNWVEKAGVVTALPRRKRDCWHYAQVPTAEYMARFGHLSYSVDELPKKLPGESRVHLCTIALTGFIHKWPPWHIRGQQVVDEALNQNESALELAVTAGSLGQRHAAVRSALRAQVITRLLLSNFIDRRS